jgi:carotenoid cleavage dioxygenase-like enzyme
LLSDEEIYCPIWDLQPEVFFEMPIINPKFKAKPYRYIYGVNYNVKPFSIMKINLANPLEVFEWKYFENDNEEFLPSEPVFVESPNAKSEDDGVLLVMVLSEANDFLSVLDAKKMVEIAKAELPADVKAAFTMRGFFADWKNYAKMSF